MRAGKKVYIISSLILAVAAAICLFFGIQVISKGFVSIGGHSTFRVVTGSMEPTIAIGALLQCKETAIEEIREGDIVCYHTQIEEIYGSVVTHRVIAVTEGRDGEILLETRGDANLTSDPYLVDDAHLIGKVTWYSGKDNILNDIMAFMTGKMGFLMCIVFPVLLASGMMMQSAVKNLQKDLALVRQKSQLLPGYTTLTYADYEEIYETLRKELLEELNGRYQEENTNTDPDSGDLNPVSGGTDLYHDGSLVHQCGQDQRSDVSDGELGI